MALPTADEGKTITELNDWENKGTCKCIAIKALFQKLFYTLQETTKEEKEPLLQCLHNYKVGNFLRTISS